MGEVVQFPSGVATLESPPKVEVGPIDQESLMRYYMVGEIVQTIMPTIFGQLMMFNIDVTEEDSPVTRQDGALMIEAFKALLCKYLGLHHPFSVLAQEVFVEDEETGMLSLSPSVSCNFTVYNQGEV